MILAPLESEEHVVCARSVPPTLHTRAFEHSPERVVPSAQAMERYPFALVVFVLLHVLTKPFARADLVVWRSSHAREVLHVCMPCACTHSTERKRSAHGDEREGEGGSTARQRGVCSSNTALKRATTKTYTFELTGAARPYSGSRLQGRT